MTLKRLVIALTMVGLALGLLSGCDSLITKTNAIVDKTYKDIADKPGFYVFKNGSFYSPYTAGASFDKSSKVTDVTDLPYRYMWFQDAKTELVPTVTTQSNSGIVYINDSALPDSVNGNIALEYFVDKGYTVGIAITNKEDVFTFNTEAACADSSVVSQINATISAPAAFLITEINKTPMDSNAPVWDQNGVITSLEKDAKYMFSGYQGTVYKDIIVSADTHYFVSNSIVKLEDANIERTKVGYFIIHMPVGSLSGLYCINSTYFFFYLDSADTIAQFGTEAAEPTTTTTAS